VNTVMKLGVPQNAGNFWTSQRTINFWRTLLHEVSKANYVFTILMQQNTQELTDASLGKEWPTFIATRKFVRDQNWTLS
jgi:hypothetical protein